MLNIQPSSLPAFHDSDLKPYVVFLTPPSPHISRHLKLKNGDMFKVYIQAIFSNIKILVKVALKVSILKHSQIFLFKLTHFEMKFSTLTVHTPFLGSGVYRLPDKFVFDRFNHFHVCWLQTANRQTSNVYK